MRGRFGSCPAVSPVVPGRLGARPRASGCGLACACPEQHQSGGAAGCAQQQRPFHALVGQRPEGGVETHAPHVHEHGVAADVIVGAKTKDILILEDEMKAVAGNLYVTTDDGSYGRSGMVTQTITDLINEGKHYDVCVAIGPMIMMKFVCKLTKELNLPTVVSLNPIMVDGTGMCGACRVTIGDEVKFACVDGPEFDGHLVNFDEAMQRQQIYKTAEGRAYLKAKEGDTHHGGCGNCGGDK